MQHHEETRCISVSHKNERLCLWIALYGTPIAELKSVTCHMESHSVTCYQNTRKCPTLAPARQTGTRFTYPRGMEGWVDLGVGYIPRMFTCLWTPSIQVVTTR